MKFRANYWILGSVILTFAIAEGSLRWGLGLGNPVLSQADADTGYRFQPNQHLVRFGKTIIYNQYSQRSQPISPVKAIDSLRILMVGDSVLNGGTPIDQSETISAVLEAKLAATGKTVEVLNASAGSWGIGNQLGYLRKFGRFDSDVLILQIGTHDLLQSTSSGDRVGIDPSYPNQRPLLAIQELWGRYLWPKLALKFNLNPPSIEIPTTQALQEQFQQNLDSLEAIVALARQEQMPIFVLYTPSWTDVLPVPSSPPYKAEFFRFLASRQIPVVDIHQVWSDLPPATLETYFRDSVHLTARGNQSVAQHLTEIDFANLRAGDREQNTSFTNSLKIP